ncbi:MAG: hypothetical protein ACOYKZ_06005 [Chlamydiia bacterium]
MSKTTKVTFAPDSSVDTASRAINKPESSRGNALIALAVAMACGILLAAACSGVLPVTATVLLVVKVAAGVGVGVGSAVAVYLCCSGKRKTGLENRKIAMVFGDQGVPLPDAYEGSSRLPTVTPEGVSVSSRVLMGKEADTVAADEASSLESDDGDSYRSAELREEEALTSVS